MSTSYFKLEEELVAILNRFGEKATKSQDPSVLLSYLVTRVRMDGKLTNASLYILAPELSYEYQPISVKILDESELVVRFFTLATDQSEHHNINITGGLVSFINKLEEIISGRLFIAALNALVNQTLLRRESRTSSLVTDKIIVGQARVAVLVDGTKINVGFVKVEGDDVYYYTGKGLKEIFKPNMNAEESSISEELQKKTIDELIASGHVEVKKLNEFIDIL